MLAQDVLCSLVEVRMLMCLQRESANYLYCTAHRHIAAKFSSLRPFRKYSHTPSSGKISFAESGGPGFQRLSIPSKALLQTTAQQNDITEAGDSRGSAYFKMSAFWTVSQYFFHHAEHFRQQYSMYFHIVNLYGMYA